MANVLGELFQDIADAIRSKTGSTDTLKPNEFPAAIEGITTGGGTSPDVRYVTFMNGDTVLYKKPVAVGDDCVDVLQKGLIETPAKESTAQYNYTFYGWGASDGGAADANILKNITEDKTVYAIFTATARYYTITYYDEDGTTVLHTESLAYGTVPSYRPNIDGKAFDRWTPTPTAVTGDASYTAVYGQWLASGTCGDAATWAISPDYVLTISGTGAMTDYVIDSESSTPTTPWREENDNIKAVVVNEGITHIGDYAFYTLHSIASITIPDSVTSIGVLACYDCTSLRNITIPDSVTSIGERAFMSCTGLTSVTIPDSVTSMGEKAFYYCSGLTSVTIGNGVTSISNYAFDHCSRLTSVTISNSVTSIDNYAFQFCTSLYNITIPDNVKHIGYNAFYGCTKLSSVVFEDTSGWYAGSKGATSGITRSMDPSSIASDLRSSHAGYHWYDAT